MNALIERAVRVAGEAADLAGNLIRTKLAGDLHIFDKGDHGDIVTDLDFEVERAVIGHIRRSFPLHRISSEECGMLGGGAEWTWLIDPLDGTNNVAIQLPVFGACITLCHDGQPVVTAIHSSHRGVTYTAARGYGTMSATTGRARLRRGFTPHRTTISWIQGYAVGKGTSEDANPASAARDALGGRFKRILQTWAPSVDWALLVESAIGAVIAYENEPEDLIGGVLLAAEAGAVVTDFAGNAVSDLAGSSSLVVAAPDLIVPILEVIAAHAMHG